MTSDIPSAPVGSIVGSVDEGSPRLVNIKLARDRFEERPDPRELLELRRRLRDLSSDFIVKSERTFIRRESHNNRRVRTPETLLLPGVRTDAERNFFLADFANPPALDGTRTAILRSDGSAELFERMGLFT
jgi:hypothetical protein